MILVLYCGIQSSVLPLRAELILIHSALDIPVPSKHVRAPSLTEVHKIQHFEHVDVLEALDEIIFGFCVELSHISTVGSH